MSTGHELQWRIGGGDNPHGQAIGGMMMGVIRSRSFVVPFAPSRTAAEAQRAEATCEIVARRSSGRRADA
jgi:hypothetical protein